MPIPADSCLLPAADQPARDTVTIALDVALARNRAPVPGNAAERLAFRQVYQSLLRLDCEGRLLPALAHQWQGDSSGRVWVVELDEYRFADGTPITASRVIESWTRDSVIERSLDHVEARDERTLVVRLARAEPSGPRALADPALAIGAREATGLWPLATGAFRFDSAPTVGGLLEYRATPGTTVAGEPVLRFLVSEGVDPRDLLAAGADLMVTRDPLTLEYAGRLAGLQIVPLPWDRTYLMVSAAGAPFTTGADSIARARFRAALARDAVSTGARGAEPPLAWDTVDACARSAPVPTAVRPRIVYPRADSTARELAERVVALAPGRLALMGLGDGELAASLRAGTDAVFILPVPRDGPSACRGLPPLPAGASLDPLIDTRAHLILRLGAARMSMDADGIPRILPGTSQ